MRHPDLYAVWNTAAEDAMVRLNLWPRFGSGWSIGQKHEAVNAAIQAAAEAVGVDLWTIDSLWWLTEREHAPEKHQFTGGTGAPNELDPARSAAPPRPHQHSYARPVTKTKPPILNQSTPRASAATAPNGGGEAYEQPSRRIGKL